MTLKTAGPLVVLGQGMVTWVFSPLGTGSWSMEERLTGALQQGGEGLGCIPVPIRGQGHGRFAGYSSSPLAAACVS
jgi:hypothetical protein